jgi:hypothetical protein
MFSGYIEKATVITEPRRTCFVIMPFSECGGVSEAQWTDFFLNDLKPAVEDAGLNYDCRRSEGLRGNIVADIITELREAHVVIADLTGNNPNVFYELAVRHALQPRTILITRDLRTVPFDLLPYGCMEYRFDLTQASHHAFRDALRVRLRDIDLHPDRPDNPVADFLGDRAAAVEYLSRTLAIRQTEALISELASVGGAIGACYHQCLRNYVPTYAEAPAPALNHLVATFSIDNKRLLANARNTLNALSILRTHAGTIDNSSRGREYALSLFGRTLLQTREFAYQVIITKRALERGMPARSVDLPELMDHPARDQLLSKLQGSPSHPENLSFWWPDESGGGDDPIAAADSEPPAPV